MSRMARDPATLSELGEVMAACLRHFEEDDQYRAFYQLAFFGTEWAQELAPVLSRYAAQQLEFVEWNERVFNALKEKGEVRTEVRLPHGCHCLFEGLALAWLQDSTLFSIALDGPVMIEERLSL